MFRATPSDPTDDDRPAAQRENCSGSDGERSAPPTDRERSADQPPGATGGLGNRLRDIRRTLDRFNCDSSRAQTSVDFVVGASVFLLTVAFVVGFVPEVFAPFTADGAGDSLAADRTASLLAEQSLADPTTPGVLNATCTAEFFSAGDRGRTDACRFDADAADLDAALGLGPGREVQVTIEDGGTVRSVRGVSLRAGPTPPETESVVVSRRVVLLGGEESDLYVRVW